MTKLGLAIIRGVILFWILDIVLNSILFSITTFNITFDTFILAVFIWLCYRNNQVCNKLTLFRQALYGWFIPNEDK